MDSALGWRGVGVWKRNGEEVRDCRKDLVSAREHVFQNVELTNW